MPIKEFLQIKNSQDNGERYQMVDEREHNKIIKDSNHQNVEK